MAGILVVVGTRPEALKLAPVIHALHSRGIKPRICATGQHGDLLKQALEGFHVRADIDLALMQPDGNLNELSARLISGISSVLAAERPERVVVQGDTSSAFAGALAAYHLKIPVSHVEAGLRSGDTAQPWPEEFNRRAIGAIADQHFAPTSRAARALLAEGVQPSAIHITGNTAIDALLAMRLRIAADPIACEAVTPVLGAARGRRLILVTCHRRENLGSGVTEIASAVRALAARGDLFLAVALHPNPAAREPLHAALEGLANVMLLPPLDYACFVRLLSAAHVVLTDSGGLQEEAPALGKPVLVLRNTTERMEGVEAGTAKLVGVRAQRIVAETCLLLDNPEAHARMARAHSPYGDGRAAERIAAVLAGETAPAISRSER
ncbi:non-hydrolyzing UDP-N-acetylglucosamine 2-epimerase [Sphingomonas sp.]|jgi:UDP-N-acetylglucosamine 2-epimerase (non-hydrolysing)|uniref:non-hydrolyzing UDP-N-acetylglucosamine 2-epimerase n=1 Tax=Sphingomonas sp. TaxID=28214 RepID=UPI002DE74903|nr:UDP-N-acetylglucosamine 2-epimerase (non-hydrolyzing) [Sphingomonas sp.]